MLRKIPSENAGSILSVSALGQNEAARKMQDLLDKQESRIILKRQRIGLAEGSMLEGPGGPLQQLGELI